MSNSSPVPRTPRGSLVLLAHPEPASFNRAILDEVLRGLRDGGAAADVADLAAEGFDPRTTAADLAHYRGSGPLPADIQREQARVDAAQALILIFPLYWWSVPALLKGWFDRVLTNGWAYTYGPSGKVEGRLADKPVRILITAGSDEEGYRKHGYDEAVVAQIERGTFGYCGLRDVETHVLFESEGGDAAARARHLETAYRVGRSVLTAPERLSADAV